MKTPPKRRLGQHFLRDRGVLDRILRLIQPAPHDIFLEIGAGHGALSEHLAPKVGRLFAVEVDRDCFPPLQVALQPYPHATVVMENILRLNISELISPYLSFPHRLRIAGNLPFYLATAIIEKILESPLCVHDMTFMVQLEVAQRITARPRTRAYGYFSVHCQHHCDVRMGFKVPPACFIPRPKIMSALVSLRPHGRKRDAEWETTFLQLAKAAFSHRRKMLANSLGLSPPFGPGAVELLALAQIDGKKRPEDLTIQEYERLAQVYQENLDRWS